MQSENTQPENIQSTSLPDTAYRELRPGEAYRRTIRFRFDVR